MIDSSPGTQGKKEGDDGQARLVAVKVSRGLQGLGALFEAFALGLVA